MELYTNRYNPNIVHNISADLTEYREELDIKKLTFSVIKDMGAVWLFGKIRDDLPIHSDVLTWRCDDNISVGRINYLLWSRNNSTVIVDISLIPEKLPEKSSIISGTVHCNICVIPTVNVKTKRFLGMQFVDTISIRDWTLCWVTDRRDL